MLPQHTVDADTNCSIIQPDQTFQCFTLAEIQLATNNFDEKLVIGRGGFGNVYKCTHRLGLVDQVALKRLQTTSNQGAREFEAEIEVLSKLRHANLVSLIGYCSEGNEMVLAYEFMPNGNLQDHLHKNGTNMSWLQRLKICIGAARGLDYLHTGTSTQHGVIHRDVKTSNILLDAKFDAKISDFGLAKIGPINQTKTFVSTLVKGTFGYMDPSYFFSGKLTRKSDVYAFGVVLFEVLSGKQAVDESIDEEQWSLAIWAQDQIKMGKLNQIIEPRLNGQISKKSLKEFANIAAQCFHNQPKKRPTMAEVVVKLDSILLQERNTTVSVGDEVKLYNRLRYLFTGKAELMTVAKGGSKYVSSSAPHDQKSNDQSISIDTLGQKEITLNHPNESTVYQSLDTHLFRKEEGKTSLSWVARLKIALGVAQGLSLLHQRKHYAYLQFKTSLILVDSENNVRLSDSEIENPFLNTGSYDFSKDTSVYAAPEWFRYQADKFDGLPNSYWIEDGITNMAGFGIKSEIYSFGVVLLEILTGLQVYDESRPDEKQNLVKWATPLLSDGENLGMIMDPQLLVNDHPPEGAFKFAKLISKCLQRDQEQRPSMKEVLQVLQECYLEETNTADF